MQLCLLISMQVRLRAGPELRKAGVRCLSFTGFQAFLLCLFGFLCSVGAAHFSSLQALPTSTNERTSRIPRYSDRSSTDSVLQTLSGHYTTHTTVTASEHQRTQRTDAAYATWSAASGCDSSAAAPERLKVLSALRPKISVQKEADADEQQQSMRGGSSAPVVHRRHAPCAGSLGFL